MNTKLLVRQFVRFKADRPRLESDGVEDTTLLDAQSAAAALLTGCLLVSRRRVSLQDFSICSGRRE